ncbi:MAG TPA: hypothetical protein VFB45_08570 [Pseudolabrys sp.]|nr:hypothetical protein [Pseudolabrys sp.]
MTSSWSSWRHFPQVQGLDPIEAPAGPGVYEVRHTLTGRAIAFGYSANVARSLRELKIDGASGWSRLFRREVHPVRTSDLEYRICATQTRSEAKTAAQRLMGLRQTYWRRRQMFNWAGSSPA